MTELERAYTEVGAWHDKRRAAAIVDGNEIRRLNFGSSAILRVMGCAVITILVIAFPSLLGAQSFIGRVVRIDGGNAVAVVTDGHILKVRLFGIDCPEKKQPGASHAAWLTKELVLNRLVTVTIHNTDRYGRMIAKIAIPDGRDLGQELVKTGNAWWNSRDAPDDASLADFEAEARDRRIGIWEFANPLPPWEWRRAKPR